MRSLSLIFKSEFFHRSNNLHNLILYLMVSNRIFFDSSSEVQKGLLAGNPKKKGGVR